MFFRIDQEIFDTIPHVCTGVVVVKGLDNAAPNPQITRLLRAEISKAPQDVSLKPYRDAMAAFGIDCTKYPCSIESILSRIGKKGTFPSISPVVDLGNYISLKYQVPVGVHDMDTISEALCIRLSREGDVCNSENHSDHDELKTGEPVYASGTSVRTRRWLWRQMPAGKITASSRNFIIPIDGFLSNQETILAACDELAELILKLFGVTAQTALLTKDSPEFLFGDLTQEEQEIENQIAVILKGVASHTPVSEIRQKLYHAKKENRPLRVKLGLDPSAPDIHIGHSVVLRKIRQIQDLGHMAVIIIGDYTGMIGDPTGKSKTRKQLSREDVIQNANTYMEQIFKIIDRQKTEVYYNSEWLSKMTFGDVIELAAKCTVARMLERDDFNNRYTHHLPLSVHEFFYPLMQAYDSVAIRADIELGGTDQTFNILMGRNIQRDYGQEPQLTLFMPLLEGIDGVEKMSKSLGNYIGISEKPAVIYEKVMKIPDSMIIRYYNLCTDLHPDEVAGLQRKLDEGTNPRDIKMMLAHEITQLYWGSSCAHEAQLQFKSIFQQGQVPDDAPVINVDAKSQIPVGEQVITCLVEQGFFKSKSEIRRIFSQNGAQFDGQKISQSSHIVLQSEKHVLRLGKNKFFFIRSVD